MAAKSNKLLSIKVLHNRLAALQRELSIEAALSWWIRQGQSNGERADVANAADLPTQPRSGTKARTICVCRHSVQAPNHSRRRTLGPPRPGQLAFCTARSFTCGCHVGMHTSQQAAGESRCSTAGVQKQGQLQPGVRVG